MASIKESDDAIAMLKSFARNLEDQVYKAEETTSIEARMRILKNLQVELFQTSLKMPFFEVKIN